MINKQDEFDSINKIVRYFKKFEEIFLIVCFMIMASTLFLQVTFRYVFNYPLTWSEELARYLLVWIAFLGINYGLHQKKHIALEYFYNKFPTSVQKLTDLVTNIIILATILYFLPGAWKFFKVQFPLHSSAMQIPMGLIYISIPIGFLLSSITILAASFRLILELIPRKVKRVR